MTTPEPLTAEEIEALRSRVSRIRSAGLPMGAGDILDERLLATLDARAPLDVERRDLLDIAWTIIANAGGGDWTLEAKDWQEAAAAWRERYHAALAAEGSGE